VDAEAEINYCGEILILSDGCWRAALDDGFLVLDFFTFVCSFRNYVKITNIF